MGLDWGPVRFSAGTVRLGYPIKTGTLRIESPHFGDALPLSSDGTFTYHDVDAGTLVEVGR